PKDRLAYLSLKMKSWQILTFIQEKKASLRLFVSIPQFHFLAPLSAFRYQLWLPIWQPSCRRLRRLQRIHSIPKSSSQFIPFPCFSRHLSLPPKTQIPFSPSQLKGSENYAN